MRQRALIQRECGQTMAQRDAIDNATAANEKVTLAAVIIEPAIVLRSDRAPSGPPEYAHAIEDFIPGSNLWST